MNLSNGIYFLEGVARCDFWHYDFLERAWLPGMGGPAVRMSAIGVGPKCTAGINRSRDSSLYKRSLRYSAVMSDEGVLPESVVEVVNDRGWA